MTNNNLLPIGFLGAALALSGAAVATAQDSAVVAKDQPTSDGNCTISSDEIDLARAALIAGADATGKGVISFDEYQTIFVELMRDHMHGSLRDPETHAELSCLLDAVDGNVIDANDFDRLIRSSDTQYAPAPFGADLIAAKLYQLSACDGDKTCAALSDLSGGSRG